MAELTLGLVGAAATVGAAALSSDSGFTGRHESSHREEMKETRRIMDDFKATLRCGDVTPDEAAEFLTTRAEAIQSENDYHESIEDYKAASWFDLNRKLKKREEVRTAKRLARQFNYCLRNLNERMNQRQWFEGTAAHHSNITGDRTLVVSNSMRALGGEGADLCYQLSNADEGCKVNYKNALELMLADQQNLIALRDSINLKHERLLNTLIKNQRRADNSRIAKALQTRVVDWKGNLPETFGELLLNGNLTVTKDGINREYHVFLFEKTILCCKEKVLTSSTELSPTDLDTNCDDTPLLLKGCIFLCHVRQTVMCSTFSGLSAQFPLNFWDNWIDALQSITLSCQHRDQMRQWEAEINRLAVAAQRGSSGPPPEDSVGLTVVNARTVRVKIHFKKEILVLKHPPMTEYEALLRTIRQNVRPQCEDSDEPLEIKYKDRDGDMVSMRNNEDVQMAFDDQPGGQVTLFVM
ncbi:Pleckstrin homology domain-containing protein [Mycena epipterygia]|nr:Pleckstrin homology domain-containing protein [Mycena epipterygia]